MSTHSAGGCVVLAPLRAGFSGTPVDRTTMQRRNPCPMDEVVAISKAPGLSLSQGTEMSAQVFACSASRVELKAERWEHGVKVHSTLESTVPPANDQPVTLACFRRQLSQRFGTAVLGAQVIHRHHTGR